LDIYKPQQKVCIIAASMRTIGGGQAVQAHDLTNKLSEAGIDVELLPIDPGLKGIFGKLQKYRYIRTIITSIAYIKDLILKLPKFDVLHVFSASFLSFIIAPAPAIVLGRLYGKRIILNYHSGEAKEHLQQSAIFVRWILGFADEVVVPSIYLKRIFGKYGIEAKIVCNFVNEVVFSHKERQNFSPNFIVTRNLESIYNIKCLLSAFNTLQKNYPEARLTIVGSGSEEASLRRYAQALELKHVLFAGRVDRDVIKRYYDQSDIMLNASNVDNMPVSILEAFAVGIPVVSTRAGGIPDIIRDGFNGLLVALNDSKHLAEKTQLLLNNQKLARELARNARSEFKARYSWPAVKQIWLSLYFQDQLG